MLKSVLAAALVAGTAFAAAAPADAAQGCGRGYHRGPYGHCRPNYGRDRVVAAPGVRLVIGNYYGGRGYWDGRRYYQHRRAYRHGWRYY